MAEPGGLNIGGDVGGDVNQAGGNIKQSKGDDSGEWWEELPWKEIGIGIVGLIGAIAAAIYKWGGGTGATP